MSCTSIIDFTSGAEEVFREGKEQFIGWRRTVRLRRCTLGLGSRRCRVPSWCTSRVFQLVQEPLSGALLSHRCCRIYWQHNGNQNSKCPRTNIEEFTAKWRVLLHVQCSNKSTVEMLALVPWFCVFCKRCHARCPTFTQNYKGPLSRCKRVNGSHYQSSMTLLLAPCVYQIQWFRRRSVGPRPPIQTHPLRCLLNIAPLAMVK